MSESPQRLLVFSPFALWKHHFETELEIIQTCLDNGWQVTMCRCSGELPICEANQKHDHTVCRLCRSRFRSGVRWLNSSMVQQQPFFSLTDHEQQLVASLKDRVWQTANEVREFKIEGADIGLAAFSSTVDAARDPEPDIRRYQENFRKHVVTGAMVFFSARHQLQAYPEASILLFNGRFSTVRPALRAAQLLGNTALVHERSGKTERYSITTNTYPHDLNNLKRQIDTVYCQSPHTEEEKTAIALQWFQDRRGGADQGWVSFTKEQQQDALPEGFDRNHCNVVIYNSSEDEMVAIEGWENQFYRNQNDAITRLMEDLKDVPELRVFLRVHPNLKNRINSQTEGLEVLRHRFPALQVIPADSSISSYALLDAADVVLTFGSTIGIEAVYAGRVSILMGRALYEDFDVCICPSSHAELVSLLQECAAGNKPDMPVGYRNGLVKYGYFYQEWGVPYKYLCATELFSKKMKKDGRVSLIRPDIFALGSARMKRWYGSCSKRLNRLVESDKI